MNEYKERMQEWIEESKNNIEILESELQLSALQKDFNIAMIEKINRLNAEQEKLKMLKYQMGILEISK